MIRLASTRIGRLRDLGRRRFPRTYGRVFKRDRFVLSDEHLAWLETTSPDPRTQVNGRMFRYDRTLLPNEYLAQIDARSLDARSAQAQTGLSIGYPAWNLLYYAVLCSLAPRDGEYVVVETGTNRGFSTIVLAQALKDSPAAGIVRTVDYDANVVREAKENLARAGLSEYVEFNVADTQHYLKRLVREVPQIDFAFLDANHEFDFVRGEFELVRPLVERAGGKVYLDNTSFGGVYQLLEYILEQYGGNLIEFRNASWSPPGNAIWQPPGRHAHEVGA